MRRQHCGYWCPGAEAPGHQYSLCWLNIHYIGPVAYKKNVAHKVNSIRKWNHILKKWPSHLRVKENAFKNVVCEMSAILSLTQCVKSSWPGPYVVMDLGQRCSCNILLSDATRPLAETVTCETVSTNFKEIVMNKKVLIIFCQGVIGLILRILIYADKSPLRQLTCTAICSIHGILFF